MTPRTMAHNITSVHSRQKQIAYGKANHLRHKQIHSRQKQIVSGKSKSLTAKANPTHGKSKIAHAKSKFTRAFSTKLKRRWPTES